VFVVAVCALGVVLALAVAALGAAHISMRRAAAAADLAALAAAGAAWVGGGPDCGRAQAVAAANGARLVACRTSPDGTVTVITEVLTSGAAALVRKPARAVARAGPGPLGGAGAGRTAAGGTAAGETDAGATAAGAVGAADGASTYGATQTQEGR
jgi:secretion/DNA translocation related TadE-like protein